MIYFIQPRDGGLVKIGYASDVPRRLRELQTGSPLPLRVVAVLEGDIGAERATHRFLRHLRARNEWFRPHPDLRDYLAGMLPGGTPPNDLQVEVEEEEERLSEPGPQIPLPPRWRDRGVTCQICRRHLERGALYEHWTHCTALHALIDLLIQRTGNASAGRHEAATGGPGRAARADLTREALPEQRARAAKQLATSGAARATRGPERRTRP